jgi:O-antigen/teichoic acid export membrane protein
MAVSRRLLKDSSLALAGRVVPRALYLLQAVLVARWLGPELNGRFVYGFATMMLAGTVGKFGLDALTTREVAQDPGATPRLVGHNLYLHAALGLAGLLLMAASSALAGKTPDVNALVGLLGVAMLFNSLSLSYTAALAGLGRFDLQAAAETLLYALMLAGAAAAIRLGTGIVGIGAAMAAASALQLGFCWVLGRRVLGPADLRFDPAFARRLLDLAWPLALTGVAVGIYYRVDSVFLSVLWGDQQVGLYDAAYTFIHGLRQLPAALSMAVFPVLSRLVLEDRSKLSSTVDSVVRFGLGVGCPLVLLAWFGAEPLLGLVYSPAYLAAARPLRILLATIPLMLADAAQSYLLIAAGRQRTLLRVTMLGAAANLVLNFALIPPFGMQGAAVATVVSEAVVLLAMQHSVRDLYGWAEFGRSLLGPFGRLLRA